MAYAAKKANYFII